MAVNRFMKPITGPRGQEYFELDYNQLAAGVLAREDAYDKNAAILDVLDQDYIQGITGEESDEAKRINSAIGDKITYASEAFGGDLSKSGDYIRDTKKYIKQATGVDSEGALINSNLKAFNKNVKKLQKMKGWSKDQAEGFVAKTLNEHQTKSSLSKTGTGEFAVYQEAMPNEWQDLHKQALDLADSMPIDKWEKDFGLTPTGKMVGGERQFFNHTTKSYEVRTSEELARKIMPVLINDPKNAAYLDSASGLSQWQMDMNDKAINADRVATSQGELEVKRAAFDILKVAAQTGDKDAIKELQAYLGFPPTTPGLGKLGPKTEQAIKNLDAQLEDDYTKENELKNIRDHIARKAVDPASEFYEVNNSSLTSSFVSNKLFEMNEAGNRKKLEAALANSGIGGVKPLAADIGEAYKTQVELTEGLKDMSPQAGKILNASKLGFKIDVSDPNAVKSAIAFYNSLTPEAIWDKLKLEGDYDIDKLNANPEYQDLNYELTDYQNALKAKKSIDSYFKKNKGNLGNGVVDSIFKKEESSPGSNREISSGDPGSPIDPTNMRNAIETAVYSGVDRGSFLSTLPTNTIRERQELAWAGAKFDKLSSAFNKANPDFKYSDVLEELPVAWFTGDKSEGGGAALQNALDNILKTTQSSPMGGKSQSLEAYNLSIGFTRGEGENFGITYSDDGKATFISKGFIGKGKDKVPHSYAFTNAQTNEFLMDHIPSTIEGESDEQTKATMSGVYFGLVDNDFNTEKADNDLETTGTTEFQYSSTSNTIVKQGKGRYILKVDGKEVPASTTNRYFPDVRSVINTIGRASVDEAIKIRRQTQY